VKGRLSLKRRRWLLALLLLLCLSVLAIEFGNSLFITFESDELSESLGTTARGSLQHGKRLPTAGKNFEAYSRLGALLGRNSVHGTVRTIVLSAYADLARQSPDLRFVYGETSWSRGGPFWPHRTHQNGLSVDFMVPVRGADGHPAVLPTLPWQRFGYDLEFDAHGRCGQLQIDFEALAQHLVALDREAKAHGSGIQLFILAPELQPLLWDTPSGRTIKGAFPVMTRPAWVRHDEHYHVDFTPPAGQLRAR
jgi:penicillin-insensitive murein DD-endopeptidase